MIKLTRTINSHGKCAHALTYLSNQSKGPVEASGISVLPDFVVEPAKFSQSAAGVPEGLAQHHLVSQSRHYNTYNNICLFILPPRPERRQSYVRLLIYQQDLAKTHKLYFIKLGRKVGKSRTH